MASRGAILFHYLCTRTRQSASPDIFYFQNKMPVPGTIDLLAETTLDILRRKFTPVLLNLKISPQVFPKTVAKALVSVKDDLNQAAVSVFRTRINNTTFLPCLNQLVFRAQDNVVLLQTRIILSRRAIYRSGFSFVLLDIWRLLLCSFPRVR